MSGKKIEKEAREKIVIDMNDFLITYAKTILGPVPVEMLDSTNKKLFFPP